MGRSFETFDISTKSIGNRIFWHKPNVSKNNQLNTYVATGSRETKIRIWDTITGECIKTFDCQSRVLCLALIPGKPDELVSGLGSGMILVWNMKSGEVLKKINGLIRKHFFELSAKLNIS
jgi:WD40 repeat protein